MVRVGPRNMMWVRLTRGQSHDRGPIIVGSSCIIDTSNTLIVWVLSCIRVIVVFSELSTDLKLVHPRDKDQGKGGGGEE